jgi:hypothetical protein
MIAFHLHRHFIKIKLTMAEPIKYSCNCNNNGAGEWPAIAFTSPDYYEYLSDEEKEHCADLSSDFCVINHHSCTHLFIRVTMTQLVIDHSEHLEYGVWVSLNEKNFKEYYNNFDNKNRPETEYFGWLCNDIPGYHFKDGIPTTVYIKPGNTRPVAVPHADHCHPFVHDYYNGISKVEADKRIEMALRLILTNKPEGGN